MKMIHHDNLFRWTWRGRSYGVAAMAALAGLALLILCMVVM